MSSLPHPALLAIDLQVGLLHGPEAPHAGAETLANINRLSQAARAAGVPVLAVRHTGPAGSPIAAGSPFWQLAPELVVDEADRVFDKHRPSAFHGTGLDGWLKEGGVQTLIVAGMKTQYCIDSTCRAAADLGYAVVLSTQHSPEVSLEQIRRDMIELVIKPTVPAGLMDGETKIYVNPTGRFVSGGPAADSGLTGRKIIVDTYGGSAPHGGGAFSGKDPTKVDRSAAYAARWVAKNVVAAGLARRCQVQLAYAIGVARPVSVLVETFGTGVVSDEALEQAVEQVFDLRPTAIIRDLDLRRPIYRQLAAYGHMGREDLGVTWERTDRVDQLKAALNLR